jgi:hypothetical protein
MTENLLGAIQAAGGRREFVSALVAGSDRLWMSWVDRENVDCWTSAFEARSVEALAGVAFPEPNPLKDLCATTLRGIARAVNASTRHLYVSLLEPDSFCALHVPTTLMREDDRRFFVCAAIRDSHRCRWSPELRRAFHHLTAAMAARQERVLDYRDLVRMLREQRVEGVGDDQHHQYVSAYVQIIRYLRIIVPARQERGQIRIAPDDIDPEFIVASLFGVSTGIAGLDQLFGGSGPILPEHSDSRPFWQRQITPCVPSGGFGSAQGRHRQHHFGRARAHGVPLHAYQHGVAAESAGVRRRLRAA